MAVKGGGPVKRGPTDYMKQQAARWDRNRKAQKEAHAAPQTKEPDNPTETPEEPSLRELFAQKKQIEDSLIIARVERQEDVAKLEERLNEIGAILKTAAKRAKDRAIARLRRDSANRSR